MRWKIRRVAILAVGLGAIGCGTPATEPPAPPPALSALQAPVERPVQDAELTPGSRYRFEDVIPGRLDVELTAPAPAVYNYSFPTATALGSNATFDSDVVAFYARDEIRLFSDPYAVTEEYTEADLENASVPAPDDLLTHVAGLPYLEPLEGVRPMTIGGIEGRALDVQVRDLPPEAAVCGRDDPEKTPCANSFVLPSALVGYAFELGAADRLIELRLPAGRVLVIQNLQSPQAQTVLDTVTFVERPPTSNTAGPGAPR